jgi:hypothetical protein
MWLRRRPRWLRLETAVVMTRPGADLGKQDCASPVTWSLSPPALITVPAVFADPAYGPLSVQAVREARMKFRFRLAGWALMPGHWDG